MFILAITVLERILQMFDLQEAVEEFQVSQEKLNVGCGFATLAVQW